MNKDLVWCVFKTIVLVIETPIKGILKAPLAILRFRASSLCFVPRRRTSGFVSSWRGLGCDPGMLHLNVPQNSASNGGSLWARICGMRRLLAQDSLPFVWHSCLAFVHLHGFLLASLLAAWQCVFVQAFVLERCAEKVAFHVLLDSDLLRFSSSALPLIWLLHILYHQSGAFRFAA